MNMILISGGRIDPDFVLDFIKRHEGDQIAAIDRGLKFCSEQGIRPNYIVGDFDSLPGGILERYESDADISIRRLKPEKDDSDTEAAFHLSLDLGVDTIPSGCNRNSHRSYDCEYTAPGFGGVKRNSNVSD